MEENKLEIDNLLKKLKNELGKGFSDTNFKI